MCKMFRPCSRARKDRENYDNDVGGKSWRRRVRIIFKVDGPGNVVTVLMSKGLASRSDLFVTKTKNDSF